MANKIKAKDFVKISFVGKMKHEGYIFDTTDEKVAKENGLFNPQTKYGAITTCVGENLILNGLEESLIGKEVGTKYTVDVNAGDTFGKKSAKNFKLVPMNVFKKQNIRPSPGLQVRFDNELGTVKSVSGGRVIVDFNHPLAGKDLVYDVTIEAIENDKVEQIKSLLELRLNLKKSDSKVEVKADTAEISIAMEMPEELQKPIEEMITKVVDVKKVVFKNNAKK